MCRVEERTSRSVEIPGDGLRNSPRDPAEQYARHFAEIKKQIANNDIIVITK